MEDLLAQAKKVAEEAEVFLVSSEETPVQFETNRLKHIHSKQSTSVALRIIREGRTGYATATELEDNNNLVNMAVETAQFGSEAQFELPSFTSFPPVEVFDADVPSVSIEDMVKLGEEMIARVREHTPDIICEAMVSRSITSIRIINSRGGQAEYRQSIFNLGIEGQLIRDTDMLFVGEGQSSCQPITQPDKITEVVLKQLDMAREQASVTTGSIPVIFTPDGIASALLMPLTAAFNGKTVLEGASPLGSKLGETVFDKQLSLWDDPTIDYRPGSRPCDDEGIPSQRTSLIDQGVVSSFFYDLQTAALAGTQSTGNGRRGRGGLPSPFPSAIVINPGNTSFNEMVSDIREGLVVEQLMGAGQGNTLGGDFSGNVLLGYKIENGKIAGRVKNTMVSGNIYQLLGQIAAIGNDTKWVGGMINTPSVLLSSVPVASK
ncbi:MAG: TldD/PmbA family protein [Dehalococcoidales bacterium]|nr:MAG: TldD/PmbA family protein [Dehalococcoidales bacterium]